MKKYWYTLLLAFSLLISAIISTLPASVYGIVTSVFVRVCSNGQEMIENIDAELSAVKPTTRKQAKLKIHIRRSRLFMILLM